MVGKPPNSHPKMIIFSRKTMVVGETHHFRKPPFIWCVKASVPNIHEHSWCFPSHGRHCFFHHCHLRILTSIFQMCRNNHQLSYIKILSNFCVCYTLVQENPNLVGGFKHFFIFTPTWGRFPTWLIFFEGVETTNQKIIEFLCFLLFGSRKSKSVFPKIMVPPNHPF